MGIACSLGSVLARQLQREWLQNGALAALATSDDVAAHALTAAERASFERDGFLVITGALDDALVSRLDAAMEAWAQATTGGVKAGTTWHGMTFSEKHEMPERYPELASLLVHPRVLGKIVGILGWNIWCYHAHATYTRAAEGAGEKMSAPAEPSGDHWHQDSGRVNADVEGDPRPRLSVKASYFLTDTSRPGSPQFWAVPGSHLNNTLAHADSGATQQPPGAVPIPVAAGSVVIIDRRLWHAGPLGAQSYAHSRKVLFYGFGPRWMRSKDPLATGRLLRYVSDPVLRQLLGHTPSFNGLYSPTPVDVPLLPWLETHGMLGGPPPVPWEDCSQSDKWIGGCS